MKQWGGKFIKTYTNFTNISDDGQITYTEQDKFMTYNDVFNGDDDAFSGSFYYVINKINDIDVNKFTCDDYYYFLRLKSLTLFEEEPTDYEEEEPVYYTINATALRIFTTYDLNQWNVEEHEDYEQLTKIKNCFDSMRAVDVYDDGYTKIGSMMPDSSHGGSDLCDYWEYINSPVLIGNNDTEINSYYKMHTEQGLYCNTNRPKYLRIYCKKEVTGHVIEIYDDIKNKSFNSDNKKKLYLSDCRNWSSYGIDGDDNYSGYYERVLDDDDLIALCGHK